MVQLTEAISEIALVIPPGQVQVLAVVRQPANGTADAMNRCVAVALGVARVRATMFNALGQALGAPLDVPVVEGCAALEFRNPTAATGYRIVIEAPNSKLRPVRSNAFNVSAAVPPPAPPAPAPVKPALSVDPATVALAVVGRPAKLRVISAGVDAFDWVIVQPNQGNTWRTKPVRVEAHGVDAIEVTFDEPGEFVKLLTPDRKLAVDSAKCPPAPAPAPAPTPAPAGEADAARRFVARLVAGVNIERGRVWTMRYAGKPLHQSPDYYRYLGSLGLTHVRFFMAVRPKVDMLGQGLTQGRMPDAALIDRLLDACSTAVAAGLRVLCDWSDVLEMDEMAPYAKQWDAYLDLVGQRIAARPDLTPEVFAPGPFNELACEKNADCNQFRLDGHAALRRRLPQHVLVSGAAYWSHWKQLVDPTWAAPPDRRVVGQWHHYEDAEVGQGFWRDVQQQLRAFSDRNGGIPTIAAEAGPDRGWDGKMIDFSPRWLASMADQAATLAGQAPTWWTVTDGRAFIMSRGGADAALRPEIESAIKVCSATLLKGKAA